MTKIYGILIRKKRSLDVLSMIVDLTATHTKNVHCLHIENQQHMCFNFIPDKIDHQQNYLATSLHVSTINSGNVMSLVFINQS